MLKNNFLLKVMISVLGSSMLFAGTTLIAEDLSTPDSNNSSAEARLLITCPILDQQGVQKLNPQQGGSGQYHDGGEFLASLPGIAVGRMGGHGLEPVIRGQQQTQLNIIEDDMFLHGGCPNRMDPPSSLGSILQTDILEVQRGYKSVRNGPGGSGGTVISRRNIPGYSKEAFVNGDLLGGYESNGDIISGGGSVIAGEGPISASSSIRMNDAHSYVDGNGNTVRSAFRSLVSDIEFGYSPDSNNSVSLRALTSQVDDALFAGSGMDSVYTDNNAVRVRGVHKVGEDRSDELNWTLYGGAARHLMDNYSLRQTTSSFARADSDSDSIGGRVDYTFKFDSHSLSLGTDYQLNNREAERRVNPMNRDQVNMLQSVLWPDADLQNAGVFLEDTISFTEKLISRLGLRYDNVRFSSNRANTKAQVPAMPGMMPLSPNDLYQSYYGVDAETERENNISMLGNLGYDLSEKLSVYSNLSSSYRTADTTERAIASNQGAMSWVGNPELDPERHDQIEIGLEQRDKLESWSVIGYYDRVSDYIFRDRARGQSGIQRNDGANIYRNIDAEIAGTEVFYRRNLIQSWFVETTGFYTYGNNLDEDQALPQIPPFSGVTQFGYDVGSYLLALRGRFAARQSRVDDDPSSGSGRDVRQTPGYFVLDLTGEFRLSENLKLNAGIKNILDKNYANHLNRSSAFNPEEIQVNEPGRSLFVYMSGKF